MNKLTASMNKLTPAEQKGLAKLHEKIGEVIQAEAEWADNLVRSMYPKWVIKLAELSTKWPFRWMQYLIAKGTGISFHRHQVVDTAGKGFKKGSHHIKELKTEVWRRGEKIAEKSFTVNVVVSGSLDKIMREVKYD